MRVVYIADDGTQFDNEFECEDYEWKLIHPHLKNVTCYDMNGEVLENIFSQTTYEDVMKIVIPTEETATELRELGRYCGFSCYEDIDSCGIWKWNEDGCYSTFVKEK